MPVRACLKKRLTASLQTSRPVVHDDPGRDAQGDQARDDLEEHVGNFPPQPTEAVNADRLAAEMARVREIEKKFATVE